MSKIFYSVDEILDNPTEPHNLGVIWEAIGPDAVEDWFDGGKEREAEKIVKALKEKDFTALGEVILPMALSYLNSVVKRSLSIVDEDFDI